MLRLFEVSSIRGKRGQAGAGAGRASERAKGLNPWPCALPRLWPGVTRLLAALPQAASLNVDETGHPDQGDQLWTWGFRAALYTLYKIDPSRGSDVLVEVLGREFDGLLGCDYFSAYRKYLDLSDARLQFCLAHTIRTQSRSGFLGRCSRRPRPLAGAFRRSWGQRLGPQPA